MFLADWNQRNRPPLSREELDAVITSIARKELLKRGEAKPNGDRNENLEVISEKFEVPFRDIVRVMGKEPYYVFSIGESTVALPAQDMYSQMCWGRAVTAAAHRVPRRIGTKETPGWDHWANLLMASAREINPGQEATEVGEVVGWLQEYLATHRPAENGKVAKKGEPVIHDGRVWIHPPAFRKFVEANFNARITGPRLVQLLSSYGFVYKNVWVKFQRADRWPPAPMRMMTPPEGWTAKETPEGGVT